MAQNREWSAQHSGHHRQYRLHQTGEDLRGTRGGQRHCARLPGRGQPRHLAGGAPHPGPQAGVAGGERANHTVRGEGHLQVWRAEGCVEQTQDGSQRTRSEIDSH